MYQTTDIILAAALISCGHPIQDIQRVGSKGTFIFDDVPKQWLLDYDTRKILVEPVAFHAGIRQLTTACKR